MMYLLGVLVAVVGIGLSIALHEIGHLLPAKIFGVKVTQYMVGFGPTIWSRQRGETQYGIKAIPLGGYVRMIGMLPPRPGDKPGELRPSSTGRWSAMVDDARAQSMEEIAPQDEGRVFYRLPFWQKMIVMAGGPLMNLVIASVLLTGIVTVHGVDEPQGVRVAAVVECVRPTTATGAPPSAPRTTPPRRPRRRASSPATSTSPSVGTPSRARPTSRQRSARARASRSRSSSAGRW